MATQKISEFPTSINLLGDEYIPIVQSGINKKVKTNLLLNDYVTPEMFGAIGNGIVDDTQAIQNCLNSGNVVHFLDKTYITGPLNITSNTTIVLNNKTIIKSTDNYDRLDCVINIVNVENINIIGNGATIQMLGSNYYTEEFRYGINICDSKNVYIENLNSVDCGGDGFYIGSAPGVNGYSENITLIDCSAKRNRRNGLSIISGKDIKIIRGTYSESFGTAPQFGIDIEPNSNLEFLQNIILDSVTTSGNGSGGISIVPGFLSGSTNSISIKIENCNSIQDGKAGGLRFVYQDVSELNSVIHGSIIVNNHSIINPAGRGIDFTRWPSTAPKVILNNPLIINTASGIHDGTQGHTNGSDGNLINNEVIDIVNHAGLVAWIYPDTVSINPQLDCGNFEVNNLKVEDTRNIITTSIPVYLHSEKNDIYFNNILIKDPECNAWSYNSTNSEVNINFANSSCIIEYSNIKNKNFSGVVSPITTHAGYFISNNIDNSYFTLQSAKYTSGLSWYFTMPSSGTLSIIPSSGDSIIGVGTRKDGRVVLRKAGDLLKVTSLGNSIYQATWLNGSDNRYNIGSGSPNTVIPDYIGQDYFDNINKVWYKSVSYDNWIASNEYVTPEMFGAKGDGVTDDTVAIQNAINTRKKVVFGAKNYLHTGLVINETLSYSNLQGQGKGITTLTCTATSAHNISYITRSNNYVSDGIKSTYDITFSFSSSSDIGVWFNSTGSYIKQTSGYYITGNVLNLTTIPDNGKYIAITYKNNTPYNLAYENTLKDMTLKGGINSGCGIYANGLAWWNFDGLLISNCGSHGIYLTDIGTTSLGAYIGTINACHIVLNKGDGIHHVGRALTTGGGDQANAASVTNCELQNNANGIVMWGCSLNCDSNTIEGNYKYGVYISSEDAYPSLAMQVTNNYFESNVSGDCYVNLKSYLSDFTYSGNTCAIYASYPPTWKSFAVNRINSNTINSLIYDQNLILDYGGLNQVYADFGNALTENSRIIPHMSANDYSISYTSGQNPNIFNNGIFSKFINYGLAKINIPTAKAIQPYFLAKGGDITWSSPTYSDSVTALGTHYCYLPIDIPLNAVLLNINVPVITDSNSYRIYLYVYGRPYDSTSSFISTDPWNPVPLIYFTGNDANSNPLSGSRLVSSSVAAFHGTNYRVTKNNSTLILRLQVNLLDNTHTYFRFGDVLVNYVN